MKHIGKILDLDGILGYKCDLLSKIMEQNEEMHICVGVGKCEIKSDDEIEEIIEEINEQSDKNQSNLYLGKNDIDEENILLDELDNEYYKDIIELNKQKIILNKNTTCILIKIFKNKEVKKEENKEENKEKNR